MSTNNSARILIVEDHTEMIQVLKKFLGERNFYVEGAENAEVAFEKINSYSPNLIIMDVMLPGISGVELTRKIRESESTENYTPILMLTAKNKVEDVVEGLEAGADDYIVKPFNFDELLARINAAIRLKKLNEDLFQKTNELEVANKKIFSLNQNLIGKNKELRKKIYELHNIFEISFELHSILDIDKLVNSALLSLIGQFSCKSALFLYPRRRNEQRLFVINSKGFYQSDVEDIKIEKSDPLYQHFAEKKDSAILTDLPMDLKKSQGFKDLEKLNLQMVAPVIIHGSEIGLICLGERVKDKVYDSNEIEILRTVNNIVSIAVSNAVLYEEVKQLSYTDGMTELHNYRYFEMRLNEEILRYSRTKQNLSLIILDVDHFKNYNDTMGHPAGDEVLRILASILKETVRENDIVSRYGGEEFAIILPNANKEGVTILAERLRKKVEEYKFPNEEVQPSGRISVSVGTASLPEDADKAAELIHKADTALYVAKRNGRNRVVNYEPNLT